MNKNEFIKETARRCMLTDYAVEEVFNVSAGLVAEKLISGEDVDLPKLGKFTLAKRKAMEGKNLFGTNTKPLEQCEYPIFKICNGIKTRIKNGLKYPKYQ